jgi:hypothetical protein
VQSDQTFQAANAAEAAAIVRDKGSQMIVRGKGSQMEPAATIAVRLQAAQVD